RGTVQMAAPVQMPPMMAGANDLRLTPPQGMLAVVPEPAAEPAAAAAPVGVEVKSPMVGTFYHSPEPGAKPYVSVGARVSKGQVLCIIEAMKIMNEIESEYAGVVKEILVEDSQPVEYGQALFRIDPNG
ncbi:MAG: acetyl-CoA carboxylase biotin carboxyl carrier protein, partial [Gemmatimonadaceae bacterium]